MRIPSSWSSAMSNGLTLVIGNRNYSSWSLRPWLFLRHHGIVFDEVRLPLDTPEFQSGIVRWSPSGRVPVLHHDGLVVWDSLAICDYVAETFLTGSGWPQERRARAQARSAAAEMHSGFAACAPLPMNCRRRPDEYRWEGDAQRDIEREAVGATARHARSATGPSCARVRHRDACSRGSGAPSRLWTALERCPRSARPCSPAAWREGMGGAVGPNGWDSTTRGKR